MEGLASLDKSANIITSTAKSVWNVGKTALGFGNPSKMSMFSANLKLGAPSLILGEGATSVAKKNTQKMAMRNQNIGMRPGSTGLSGITPAY